MQQKVLFLALEVGFEIADVLHLQQPQETIAVAERQVDVKPLTRARETTDGIEKSCALPASALRAAPDGRHDEATAE